MSLPKIALTVGDPAGIGPEIVAKAAADPSVRAVCEPIVFAPPAGLTVRAGEVSAAAGRAAFDTIVTRMGYMKPDIAASNVRVSYRGSGLGFAGDPNGMEIAPLVTVELTGAGAQVLMGEPKQTIGHLEGRAQASGLLFNWGATILRNEVRVEWLVRAAGPLTVTAKSEKGGTARQEIALG